MNAAHPLPAETHIGPVALTVADLDRQIAFHTEKLGFALLERGDGSATLGAGERALFHLVERPDAPRPRRATGLYHTAILVPERRDLARLLLRIAEQQTPIQGMTDHGTHLAIYLPDAEGNGLELAWDRPKSEWPMEDGELTFVSAGLDPEPLLAEATADDEPWPGLPAGTTVGHVHLHVSRIPEARRFYHDLLGFDIKAEMSFHGALFVSAGGYHHHVGLNTWKGEGAPPPPPEAIGLRHFTIVLPDSAAVEALRARLDAAGVAVEARDDGLFVRDPAQNGILLTSAT